MRRWWAVVALVGLGAVFTWPCGPFLPEFEYAPVHGPVHSAADVERYDRGQIGVVRAWFFRQPLIVAYRYLSGVPLGEAEVKALAPRQAVRDNRPWEEAEATGRWLKARTTVMGPTVGENLNAYKEIPGGQFEMFLNCTDDAFDTAVATLKDREAKWGASSANVAEWLRGQDQVFENCAKGPAIPAALNGGDALLAADRQYQIAAAEFYAGQYADAERDFEAVAGNADSPWRVGGHYLAARALIRDGTIHSKPESLKAAEAKLEAVIADPAQKRWHDSARGLIQFIGAALDPEGRMVEAAKELTQPGGDFRRAMTDYTYLYDKMEERKSAVPAGESELTDWIATFQGGKAEHAVERWRAGKSTPWLVAALGSVKATDAAVPDLIAAARQMAPEAPGYASATYYGIRLEIQRGENDAAREWADRALATKQLDSTVNLLREERLKLARDWAEFLRFAPRKPVGLEYTFLGYDDAIEGDPAAQKKTVALDVDFTHPMNTAVPLELWNEAARGDVLPRSLQSEIARTGWARAVVLGDKTARPLAERTRELNPAWAAAVTDYLKQTDPAAAKFTAVFWMLRTPGMTVELRNGLGRTTAPARIDDLRDNWWQVVTLPAEPGDGWPRPQAMDLYPYNAMGPSGFLAAAQKTAGEEQAQRLKESAGNAVNYLCAAAIAWAKAHPQDPRVPEALHLAVRATRYGVTDKESSGFSKEAFELLHRKYPGSTWAKQTKYWF
jgi:tetratricopeptide (TPR) repeat protein